MKDHTTKVFYVLNIGRSGSNSLTSYLQYAKNARIFHEPPSTQEYLGSVAENERLGRPLSNSEIFAHYRKSAIELVNQEGKIFGETTPMMNAVADGIVEVFPDVKLVWLLRDPRKWLASAAHVNFQLGHIRRLCWYWAEQQGRIYRGYMQAKPENRCMIKRELLTADRLYDLYRWLSLEPQHEGAQEWMQQDFRGHVYHGPKWFSQDPKDWDENTWIDFSEYILPKHEMIQELYKKEELKSEYRCS